jgi:hypothetical protein
MKNQQLPGKPRYKRTLSNIDKHLLQKSSPRGFSKGLNPQVGFNPGVFAIFFLPEKAYIVFFKAFYLLSSLFVVEVFLARLSITSVI